MKNFLKSIIFLILFPILLSPFVVSAQAQPNFSNMEIMIDGDVIVHNLPHPSLTDLKANGYMSVGIGVLNYYHSQEDLARIGAYLVQVHELNLTAFTMLYGNSEVTLTGARLAARMGFDAIDIDEPFSQSHMNTTQLLTVIQTVTAQYPRVRFVVTESIQSFIQTIYAQTWNLTNVDVAEDSYSDQIVLTGNVGLAQQYHKIPYVWLMAVGTETSTYSNTNCYTNWNDWLNLASQQRAAPIMFLIDSAGKWLHGPLGLKAGTDSNPVTAILHPTIPQRILERKLLECNNVTRTLICLK